MDVLTMLRTAWRHKWAALPAVLLTVVGLVYLAAYSPKVYTLTVSQLLLAPPPPPPEASVSSPGGAPGLGNPLSRLPSQSVVVDLVARRVMTAQNQERLHEQGASAEYEVVPSIRYGTASPILDVNVEGVTPAATSRTAELVGARVQEELRAMQTELGVRDEYMFTSLEVASLDPPRLQTSALLRSLIAVAVAGALLALGAISVAEGFESSRRSRARVRLLDQTRTRSPSSPEPGQRPSSVRDSPGASLTTGGGP